VSGSEPYFERRRLAMFNFWCAFAMLLGTAGAAASAAASQKTCSAKTCAKPLGGAALLMKDKTRSKRRTPLVSSEEGGLETAPAGTDHSTIYPPGSSLEEGKMETASATPPRRNRHRRRTPPPRRGVASSSTRTRPSRGGSPLPAPYTQGHREHRRRRSPTPPPTPAPDFWSKCYLDETCRAADQGKGFAHQRDNCIELECQESGLHYDTSHWIDCGGWQFKGYCNAVR